jgi:hypothetical protein
VAGVGDSTGGARRSRAGARTPPHPPRAPREDASDRPLTKAEAEDAVLPRPRLASPRTSCSRRGGPRPTSSSNHLAHALDSNLDAAAREDLSNLLLRSDGVRS